MWRAAETAAASRRAALVTLAAACAATRQAMAHGGKGGGPRGLVLPRPPAPVLDLTTCSGRREKLASLLAGRVTAVQLMFTGCASSCPPQGAMFAAVAARRMPPDVRLLSLSIDALGDSPQSLSTWLGRFGRHADWIAAVPRPEGVDEMIAFMTGVRRDTIAHTTQVFLFDRGARLAFRTVEHPTPEHVSDLLGQLARA